LVFVTSDLTSSHIIVFEQQELYPCQVIITDRVSYKNRPALGAPTLQLSYTFIATPK